MCWVSLNVTLQIADEKKRDKWVEELFNLPGNGSSDVDTGMASTHIHPEIPSQLQLLDIPSISYTSRSDHSMPPAPGSSRPVVQRIQPQLEPVKTEDGSRYYLSLQRTKSTDSDFPRSRTVSLYSTSMSDSDYEVTSESGYLSGDVGLTRSRSDSYENLSDCDHSQSASPDDPNKSFLFPVCQVVSYIILKTIIQILSESTAKGHQVTRRTCCEKKGWE